MKNIFVSIFILFVYKASAQELFVFTEPASNMAAKTVGIRLNNYLMKQNGTSKYNYHLLPELMIGVSKKIMLHGEMFLSNRDDRFTAEGGSMYLKYRFFSIDDVHSHFRMAAFGRYSFNNSHIHQQAIDFFGNSSGYEGGMVATKLVNKIAISASSSLLHATENGVEKFPYGSKERNALNYTLSIGKLMLPKEYTNYDQTNLNLMCELLGQTNLGNNKTYFDIAPSLQLIFKSRMRLDLGYRFPVVNQLMRTADRGMVVKFEYNFFNVF
ncbi:MAG: hypothetical protein V4685_11600 [Bacteroidota bacterium]